MLKGNPNVFHYTTFATADKLFAQHPIWQQARVEAERKLIFEEYVAELKQREVVRIYFCFTIRYTLNGGIARVTGGTIAEHLKGGRVVQRAERRRDHAMAESPGIGHGV